VCRGGREPGKEYVSSRAPYQVKVVDDEKGQVGPYMGFVTDKRRNVGCIYGLSSCRAESVIEQAIRPLRDSRDGTCQVANPHVNIRRLRSRLEPCGVASVKLVYEVECVILA